MRIIVTGLIAQYPLGGVVWDYIQYVLGFRQLGHDVYYFEDTEQWPYNPQTGGIGKDCHYNVEYLSKVMRHFGLDENWAYCFPWQTQWFGLPDKKRKEVVESADLLINISGVLPRPEKYRSAKKLIYIDSDPVFTQIRIALGHIKSMVDQHDVFFSFGECLAEASAVPDTGHQWIPTRQPIILSQWQPNEHYRDFFTTIMNWTSYKDIEFRGTKYGQKDSEFKKFMDLPSRVAPSGLELAVNVGKTRHTPMDLLKHKGWNIADPNVVCPDLESYRAYIQSSKGEFSVAKHGYAAGQSGWFSCRSACYLAAGKPVVLQETGFSRVLPVGAGLFAFNTLDEAVDAIKQVETNHDRHARAARALAEEYFDSDRVLDDLINHALESD